MRRKGPRSIDDLQVLWNETAAPTEKNLSLYNKNILFDYEAVNDYGQVIKGFAVARSRRQAIKDLQKKSLYVVKITIHPVRSFVYRCSFLTMWFGALFGFFAVAFCVAITFLYYFGTLCMFFARHI